MPSLHTRTRLVVLMHRDETRKPTNTGRLATLCLPNSEIVRRGDHRGEPPISWNAETQPLLLFPVGATSSLTEWTKLDRPVTLIVPDGTWRQAAKMRKRVAELADVPCVSLPPGEPTIYRLRSERRVSGLATMEAIARAFGVLEGADIESALAYVFQVMVERTLWSRGQLPADRVLGGIPEGAKMHDPLSGI